MLRIAQLRKARGMSQRQLAELVGISGAVVAEYELGRKTPRLETARKLAAALGCSIDELIDKEVVTA